MFFTRFKENIKVMRKKNSTISKYAQLMSETGHTDDIKENTMEVMHITNKWKNLIPQENSMYKS
jgi:hypothetical protein